MDTSLAIVMAGGKGTRMESELPKVLIKVLDRPMIEYVIDALREAGIERIVVVVGYQGDLVKEHLSEQPGVEFVVQAEQLGTGHAVMMAKELLADETGTTVVVAGDSPMMRADSVKKLLDEFRKTKPALLLGTANTEDPTGLGRIVRDDSGKFTGIVEEKDATEEQRKINEVNMSTYVFDNQELFASLDLITSDNAQGEYYLTDCPVKLLETGKNVDALPVLHPSEALSINTKAHLALVEEAMRK